ncbi:MAG: NAD-dependent epimerase/dehydratase family protein [Acidimicrobiales bacterium]
MSADLLVVGGAGFIGSALVRELATSHKVRVLDDMSTGKAVNVEGVANAELVVGSLLDRALVAETFKGIDVVFHLACLGVRHSIHSPELNHDVNATGTLQLLEAARAANISRFVYTSTSEVYGTATSVPMPEVHPTLPHTVYGGSKLAGEAYVRAYHCTYGMPTVVLRPFNAYGPRSHHEGDSGEVIPKFILRAMNGLSPLIFGDGTQTRDFTYVEDTARGIAAAATSQEAIGATINLGSGLEIPVSELADFVLEATGRTDVKPEHRPERPGDILRLLADSSLAVELLDWRPTVDLKTGISKLLAWHQEQGTDWEVLLAEDRERNWEKPTS